MFFPDKSNFTIAILAVVYSHPLGDNTPSMITASAACCSYFLNTFYPGVVPHELLKMKMTLVAPHKVADCGLVCVPGNVIWPRTIVEMRPQARKPRHWKDTN
jgi:hypothetical protein